MHRAIPIRVSRTVIPNTITGGAIFSGYISIMKSYQGEYTAAAWFILLACLLDFLDGRVARLIKASSDFGIQFDSLADVVNYGVAPSLLFYFLYFQEWGFLGITIAFLPVVCAAMRLARYNLDAEVEVTSTHFVGLPTTMAAAFMAGFILFAGDWYVNFGSPNIAAALMILVALLMISKVQYEKRNILSPRFILKDKRVITGSIILATVVVAPTLAVFGWALLYVLYGLARSTHRFIID